MPLKNPLAVSLTQLSVDLSTWLHELADRVDAEVVLSSDSLLRCQIQQERIGNIVAAIYSKVDLLDFVPGDNPALKALKNSVLHFGVLGDSIMAMVGEAQHGVRPNADQMHDLRIRVLSAGPKAMTNVFFVELQDRAVAHVRPGINRPNDQNLMDRARRQSLEWWDRIVVLPVEKMNAELDVAALRLMNRRPEHSTAADMSGRLRNLSAHIAEFTGEIVEFLEQGAHSVVAVRTDVAGLV